MKDAGLRAQRENDGIIRDSEVGNPNRSEPLHESDAQRGSQRIDVGLKRRKREMPQEVSSTVGTSSEGTARGIAKVFRDVTVYGDQEVLDALIPAIECRLADGWSRDLESEKTLAGAGGQLRFFLFVRRASAEWPAVKLAMCSEGRRLSVTNVMPRECGRISCAQYNSILIEFYLKFLHPAAEEAGLPIELSPDERSLESEYGRRGLELLKRFSVCANKTCTHPSDQRRWMDFLIHLHHRRPNRDYGFALLAKWLIDDGWSRDKTSELISQCEFALPLLSAYDSALGLAD